MFQVVSEGKQMNAQGIYAGRFGWGRFGLLLVLLFSYSSQPLPAQTPGPAGPPSLTGLSPNIGTVLGGTVVTLTGNYLYLPSQVTFGGVPGTVTSSGVKFIKVITPSHAVGAVDVTVTNALGQSATLALSYTFTITITTPNLPDGIAGISYYQQLAVTGGVAPYKWRVVAGSGSLPSGLILAYTTGVIRGFPAANYGTFTFTVQAWDSSPIPFTSTAVLSVTIDIGLHPGAVPSSFFGLSVTSPNYWPTATIGAFGKGGQTTWPYLETARGQFNWARMDAYVANAQAHGITLFWTNHDVPQWAAADTSSCRLPAGQTIAVCTSMVADITTWDEFCTALATRYKGQISMYELWNEPDTAEFTGTLANMVSLSQHAYNIIRAIDPAALIATPSATSATWLANYFAAGGPTGIDVIAIHGYLQPAGNQPEDLASYKAVPWHTVMLQYGLGNKPIRDTEGSWGRNAIAGLNSDAQAAFLARFYLLHWSAGITVFDWYSWDDPNWGTLWNSATGVSKAGAAYSQVYQWMTGASMPYPCSAQGTVNTCTLLRANGYHAIAVWDAGQTCTTGGGCTTSNLSPPANFIQYRDLTGTTSNIQPGQVVLIGAKPILLENMNPPN